MERTVSVMRWSDWRRSMRPEERILHCQNATLKVVAEPICVTPDSSHMWRIPSYLDVRLHVPDPVPRYAPTPTRDDEYVDDSMCLRCGHGRTVLWHEDDTGAVNAGDIFYRCNAHRYDLVEIVGALGRMYWELTIERATDRLGVDQTQELVAEAAYNDSSFSYSLANGLETGLVEPYMSVVWRKLGVADRMGMADPLWSDINWATFDPLVIDRLIDRDNIGRFY